MEGLIMALRGAAILSLAIAVLVWIVIIVTICSSLIYSGFTGESPMEWKDTIGRMIMVGFGTLGIAIVAIIVAHTAERLDKRW